MSICAGLTPFPAWCLSRSNRHRDSHRRRNQPISHSNSFQPALAKDQTISRAVYLALVCNPGKLAHV